MLIIKNTMIKKRYNIVDDSIPSYDDEHYIRQISKEDLKSIIKSGVEVLSDDTIGSISE